MNTTDIPINTNQYLPYLKEIRKRLLFIISITVGATVVGFFQYDRIIGFVITMLDLDQLNVVFTSPFQYFELAISAALLVGVIVALPVIIIQLFSFLRPALQKSEYRMLLLMLPIGLILFVGGFIFGVAIMKYTIAFFQTQSEQLHIGSVLDISSLLSSIITISLFMGLAFQFPLILTLLLQLQVIHHKWLGNQRKFVYLAALLLVILLPITSIVTDVILTLPLVILFEITLILNIIVLKRKST